MQRSDENLEQASNEKLLILLTQKIISFYLSDVKKLGEYLVTRNSQDVIEGLAHLFIVQSVGVIDAKYWILKMTLAMGEDMEKDKFKDTMSHYIFAFAEDLDEVLFPKTDQYLAFEGLQHLISSPKFSYSNLRENPILIFEYIKLLIVGDQETHFNCDIQHVLPYLDDKEKITDEQIFNELTQLFVAGRTAETLKLLVDFGIYQKLFACMDADMLRWLERKMLAIDAADISVSREAIFSLFLTAYIIDDLHEEQVAYESILNLDNNHEALRRYAALAMETMHYPKELIDAILAEDKYIHFIISEIRTDIANPKWYRSHYGLFQPMSNNTNRVVAQQELVNSSCNKFGYPSKSGA